MTRSPETSGDSEQLSLIPEPEFAPSWPSPNTRESTMLDLLLEGRTVDHVEFIDNCGSWRAAAWVFALRERGWPVDSFMVPAPTPDFPERRIARYALPHKYIRIALEIRYQQAVALREQGGDHV